MHNGLGGVQVTDLLGGGKSGDRGHLLDRGKTNRIEGSEVAPAYVKLPGLT
jgi:hypothetical protein